MDYSKPVLFVSNPNSGDHSKGMNPVIEKGLKRAKIQYESFETTGRNSAMEKAKTFKIDDFSAILIAAGDGTIHEVVNGMLSRQDKKKLPLGLIPKGTGNDTCYGLNIHNMETSMEYIRKGDTMKIDVIECLIDYDSKEEMFANLPEDKSQHDFLRYSITNSTLSLLAQVAYKAQWLKPRIGKFAYQVMGFYEVLRFGVDKYDIYYKDPTGQIEKLREDFDVNYLMAYNGKVGGGNVILNPLGMINDGAFELMFAKDTFSRVGFLNAFHQVAIGGCHSYHPGLRYYRTSELKLVNKSTQVTTLDGKDQEIPRKTVVDIDGETFHLEKSIQYKCLPSALEIIV
eukprot:CAMPEP_0170496922 /NCGR_PEP_ID=MMETSP0208-20121228/23126_1 /TAXON_ID=197538 /ORGANISM="Strombidium inclinatum, Strain S3" /LENGTH=341 /DNA_ID=CAMNT_0010773581 /DNA_START=328 /DNA_END=1350 /DNA_ORIENTATION=-